MLFAFFAAVRCLADSQSELAVLRSFLRCFLAYASGYHRDRCAIRGSIFFCPRCFCHLPGCWRSQPQYLSAPRFFCRLRWCRREDHVLGNVATFCRGLPAYVGRPLRLSNWYRPRRVASFSNCWRKLLRCSTVSNSKPSMLRADAFSRILVVEEAKCSPSP